MNDCAMGKKRSVQWSRAHLVENWPDPPALQKPGALLGFLVLWRSSSLSCFLTSSRCRALNIKSLVSACMAAKLCENRWPANVLGILAAHNESQ